MKNNREFEDFIVNFAKNSKDIFDSAQVYDAMPLELHGALNKNRVIDDIEKILMHSDEVVYIDDNASQPLFLNIANFLNGAMFCVSPTEWEIENGVLIIGDRFQPFENEFKGKDINVAIVKNGSKKIIGTNTTEIESSQIETFFHFLPAEKIQKLLNSAAKSKSTKKVRVKCLSLKELYQAFSFKKGESLRFSIEDYNSARLKVDHVSISEKQAHLFEIRKWTEKLEQALLLIYEESGCYLSASEQLFFAFAHNRELLVDPLVSIEEFLRISQNLEIAEKNGLKFFLPKGLSPEDEENQGINDNFPLSISMSDLSSLNVILKELETAYSKTSIEAFMLNELNKGKNSFENLIMEIFADCPISFFDEAQRTVFLNEMEELWEDLSENYDPLQDKNSAGLRSSLLDMLKRICITYRNKEKNFPWDIVENIEYLLEKLNSYWSIGNKELDNIRLNMKALEVQIINKEKEFGI